MKWIVILVVLCVIPTRTSSAQHVANNQSTDTIPPRSSNSQEIEEMRQAAVDRGHWIGLRIGVQTNGGEISDRWLAAGMYEWKYSNTFSLPVEIQLFRHRAYAYNEFGQLGKVIETRPILSVGLKARTKLGRLSPYLQVGLEYLSGSGFFLTTPNYAVGLEIFLSDRIVLYTNIRKSIVPDYYHFISIGFNLNVVPFVH
jgi:hypothetical protein